MHSVQVILFSGLARGAAFVATSPCRAMNHPASQVPVRTPTITLDATKVVEPTLWTLPAETVGRPLTILLCSQLVLFAGVGAVIPTIALYGKAIGLSSAMNGVVLLAPAVALTLLARPSGGFADRARKPAMLLGMGIIVVSDIGTAFANDLGTLVLARLGLGAGRCLSECGERGYLADLALRVPSLRGELAAAQQATCALGIAIGAPLGGLAVESYGPRAAFLCVSVAAALTCCLYSLLPETVGESTAAATAAVTAAADQSTPTGGETFGSSSTNLKGGGEASWSELLREGRWKAQARARDRTSPSVGMCMNMHGKVRAPHMCMGRLHPWPSKASLDS